MDQYCTGESVCSVACWCWGRGGLVEELVLPGELDFFPGVSFWWCSVLPTMHGEKLCSLTGRLPQLYWRSVHYTISLNGVWISVQLFIHHGSPLVSFSLKWHECQSWCLHYMLWSTGCLKDMVKWWRLHNIFSVRGICKIVLVSQRVP